MQSYGVKVGPEPQDWGPRDLGTLGPGTWDPPQSLKVGPGTPLKFKIGTPGSSSKFKSRTSEPPSKFKSGTPHLSLKNSFFAGYLIVFYLCVFFK